MRTLPILNRLLSGRQPAQFSEGNGASAAYFKRAIFWRVVLVLILSISTSSLSICLIACAGSISIKPDPQETELEAFKSAIKNMQIAWNADDPRTEEERLKALFEFMTETYGGLDTFGVPESTLKGNFITRSIWDYNDLLGRQVGLVLWPENKDVPAYGMSASKVVGPSRSYTSGCLMCHIAEIDGVVYFGAGNKVFDEKRLVDIAIKSTSSTARALLRSSPQEKERMGRVHEVLKRQRHSQTDPLTRGLSTAFVRSHVEFYRSTNSGESPPIEEVRRGDAKTPPLWHYAAKKPFQRWYLDGSLRGEYPLMASSMELPKGRSVEELEQIAIPKIIKQFESVIAHIRPPKYLYPIDWDLASKGERLFYAEKIGCYKCHGIYDGNGNVQWTGRHVNVGTDEARLNLVSGQFVNVFDESPLAKRFELELIRSRGYPATPLTGVWANFPYLHNGSVPTLYHLLGPASERPKIFYVFGAKHFDGKRAGQKLLPEDFSQNLSESELMDRYGADRDWFNVNRPGNGNMGHDFWYRIQTDANRKALIEYLKTL